MSQRKAVRLPCSTPRTPKRYGYHARLHKNKEGVCSGEETCPKLRAQKTVGERRFQVGIPAKSSSLFCTALPNRGEAAGQVFSDGYRALPPGDLDTKDPAAHHRI